MLGPALKFVDRNYVIHESRKLLYFGGIDYHRMSNHPEVLKAFSEAAFEYGLSSTGSRTTTGNHPLHVELEKKIAEFFETESAVVFASGYLSNIILLQAIWQNYDLFLLDSLSHSSIVDAVKQFDKEIIYFEHLETQSLNQELKNHSKARTKPLILTDGVFPSRGEIPPLEEYVEVIIDYGGKILIDDAHAMATVGVTGKGSWEDKNIDREIIYQTGTLSKGFGVYGGIILATNEEVQVIHENSPAFIGSTGLPLPLAAAAIRSISYILSNRGMIQDLQQRSLQLKEKFRQMGFDVPQSVSPIISITHYDEKKNNRLSRVLLENGIYPSFLNYPGSPPGGHFRFAISSIHTDEHLDLLFRSVEPM
jgi:7-keto-8-aminopelargonate synthetase-like enzyme